MKQILKLGFLGLVTVFGTQALGAGRITINCDDNNIFEVPLTLSVQEGYASAEGSFSGPGDAIFDIGYKNLKVERIKLDSEGTVEALDIEQPKFSVSLKTNTHGELAGHVSLVSSDEDHISYDGHITCEVK